MSSDKIGYRKPPVSTQFARGVSGNPKGRPRGAQNVSTVIQKVGRQMVNVNIGSRTVRMSRLEAIVQQLSNRAAGGDLKAIHELLYWSRIAQEPLENGAILPEFGENDHPVVDNIVKRLREIKDSQPEPSPENTDSPN